MNEMHSNGRPFVARNEVAWKKGPLYPTENLIVMDWFVFLYYMYQGLPFPTEELTVIALLLFLNYYYFHQKTLLLFYCFFLLFYIDAFTNELLNQFAWNF